MGQKTNPKLFRLVINQNFLSNWYAPKEKYSYLIKEDIFCRDQIKKSYSGFLKISSISIFRNFSTKGNQINIELKALHPRETDLDKKTLEFLEDNNLDNIKLGLKLLLEKKAKEALGPILSRLDSDIFLKIVFIENQFEDAMLIAQEISNHLERRVPFRRVMREVLKKIKLAKIEGAKIQLSGRLNGIEIARTEWNFEGKIPLHTLDANIDFAQHEIKTIFGIIGVKVWLHK